VPLPIAIGTDYVYSLVNKTYINKTDFLPNQKWLDISYDDIDYGNDIKIKIIYYDELLLSGTDKEIFNKDLD